MIKKSSIALRDSKILMLSYNLGTSNIEEFDDLIYNVYVVDINTSLQNHLGVFLVNGYKRFESSVLVLSKELILDVQYEDWLLEKWISSEFSVFLDVNNEKGNRCYGDFCYYIDDISKLTNKNIDKITRVGKCVIEEELKSFNKNYENLSEFYPDGLFDEIESFVLLKKDL